MKRFLFVIWLLFIAIAEAQIHTVTLDSCINFALQHNRSIQSAHYQIKKQKQLKKSAFTNFLPTVEMNAAWLYRKDPFEGQMAGGYLPTYTTNPATGELIPNLLIDPNTGNPVIGADGNPVFAQYAYMPDIQIQVETRGTMLYGLTMTQPLFTGGKIWSGYKMSSIAQEIAEIALKLQKETIQLQVSERYWRLVSLKQKLKLAEKYEALTQNLVERLQDSYSLKLVTRKDVLKAEVQLNEARLKKQQARHGYELAQMDLARIVGWSLRMKPEPADTSAFYAPLLTVALPKINIENRPEMQLLNKRVEISEKQVHFTRADFLPQVGLQLSYAGITDLKINGSNVGSGLKDASLTVLASLKIPVFHWGERFFKTGSAKTEVKKQQVEMEDQQEAMMLQARQSQYDFENAVTRAQMTRLALEQAQENLSLSDESYRAGLESLTDLLKAQADWQNANSNFVDAGIELRLNWLRYLKNSGNFNLWSIQ